MSTTRKQIENALMRGADSLRDTIDAANYKDYVLPIMFLKYLSDSYREEYEKLIQRYKGDRHEKQKIERQKNIYHLLLMRKLPLNIYMNPDMMIIWVRL